MPDHKFEPFDRVLVRNNGPWFADFFSHRDENGACCTVALVCPPKNCIPYTPETAHLLGTTAPYYPPKQPHEYKWGDRVEVFQDGVWKEGIVLMAMASTDSTAVFARGKLTADIYLDRNIRPLEPANEEITVIRLGEIDVDVCAFIHNETDAPIRAIVIQNYPGHIGEAELYAIKTALEKQVQLNAEVERIKARRESVLTAAQ